LHTENISNRRNESQVPFTSVSLDRANLESSPDPLQLLPNAYGACAEIDILPPEAKNLAAPHAVVQKEHKSGIQAMLARDFEEASSFISRPRFNLVGFVWSEFH